MLQIISGKFFESDDRHNYDCKGILYSNISWFDKIQTCVATLEPADVYGQTSGYVMSYNNQIEQESGSGGFQLLRTGDDEIQKQFKYLCTFGLKAFFNEDRNVVYKMCRTTPISSYEHYVPSGYIDRFLDLNLHATQPEIDSFISFVSDVIDLPRKAYRIVMNCLGAFDAAIKLLDDDINLAYSMMIYCAETLAQSFDRYSPIWDDYPQNQRAALEKCFNDIQTDQVESIKKILLQNEHLKLSRRFVSFITQYLDDDFYINDACSLNRAITKDEADKALLNAYYARSKYVHTLEPIMKQLTDTRIVNNNDIFEFCNDSFLTFNGLTRMLHKTIWNCVKNYPKASAEKINWRNELPGIVRLEFAPQYWVWQVDGFTADQLTKRLEGFFKIIVSKEKEIPDMRPLLERCLELFDTFTPEQKTEMFCLYKLYNTFIREEDRSDGYRKFIEDNEVLLSSCSIVNIALITLPVPTGININWDLDLCEEVLKKYNRKKFDGKHIRLPKKIETMIYLNMANSFKGKDEKKQIIWLKHALYNCSGVIDLQEKISDCIKALDTFDIISVFKGTYQTTNQV